MPWMPQTLLRGLFYQSVGVQVPKDRKCNEHAWAGGYPCSLLSHDAHARRPRDVLEGDHEHEAVGVRSLGEPRFLDVGSRAL